MVEQAWHGIARSALDTITKHDELTFSVQPTLALEVVDLWVLVEAWLLRDYHLRRHLSLYLQKSSSTSAYRPQTVRRALEEPVYGLPRIWR